MAIAYVQSGSSYDKAATSTTVTLTASPAAGNLLLAVIGYLSQTACTNSLSGMNATWSLVQRSVGTGVSAEVWRGWGANGTGTVITITPCGQTTFGSRIAEFSGAASAIDGSGSVATNTASPNTGAASTVSACTVVFGGAAQVGESASSAGPTDSFIQFAQVGGTAGVATSNTQLWSAYRLTTAPSTYTTNWTVTVASAWAGAIGAFAVAAEATNASAIAVPGVGFARANAPAAGAGATVAVVPGVSFARANVPTVSAGVAVTGLPAVANAAAIAPTVTTAVMVSGLPAVANAIAPVPTVSAGGSQTVDAVPAVALARANAPALSTGVVVSGLPIVALASAPAPTATAAQVASAVPAKANASAPAPTVTTSSMVAVTATAQALASAPAPSVSVSGNVTVAALPAITWVSAPAPTVETVTLVQALVAAAQAIAPVPGISTSWTAQVAVASAVALVCAPTVTTAAVVAPPELWLHLPARNLTAVLHSRNLELTMGARPLVLTVPARRTAPAGIYSTSVQVQAEPMSTWALLPAPAVSLTSALLDNLVGYWALEEASGTRVDATGRGNDLDSNRSTPGNAAGFTNNALSLNGSQAIYRASTTDLQTGAGSWSVAAIVQETDTTAAVIATKAHLGQATAREWTLVINDGTGSTRCNLTNWDAAGAAQSIFSEQFGAMYVGIWYLVMAGYDAGANEYWISVNNIGRNTATPTLYSSATAANFGLGAYADGLGAPFTGKIDEVAFAKRAWSASDRNALANCGAFLPYPFTATVSQAAPVFFAGDSLTIGTPVAAASAYPSQWATAVKHVEWINRGVSGQTLVLALNADKTSIDPYVNPLRSKNTCVVWLGTNDLYGGATAATVYANLQTYCADRHTAGFQKVVVLTICPRQDVGVPGGFEANRLTLNTNIRNNWASFCEGYADPGNAAELADPTNETYYQADKVHMTAAGYAVVAGLVQAAIAAL